MNDRLGWWAIVLLTTAGFCGTVVGFGVRLIRTIQGPGS